MTIKKGDCPEADGIHNKFIGKSGDGYRGKLVAIDETGTEAVIKSVNGFSRGDVKPGHLYLVREPSPRHYPKVVMEIFGIPEDFKKVH